MSENKQNTDGIKRHSIKGKDRGAYLMGFEGKAERGSESARSLSLS